MIATGIAPKHQRTFEWVFLAVCLTLFLYSLADWRGWLPFERGFQPLRMVLISASLTLQPVAALLQVRSQWLQWGLLAVATVMLIMSFVVAS